MEEKNIAAIIFLKEAQEKVKIESGDRENWIDQRKIVVLGRGNSKVKDWFKIKNIEGLTLHGQDGLCMNFKDFGPLIF